MNPIARVAAPHNAARALELIAAAGSAGRVNFVSRADDDGSNLAEVYSHSDLHTCVTAANSHVCKPGTFRHLYVTYFGFLNHKQGAGRFVAPYSWQPLRSHIFAFKVRHRPPSVSSFFKQGVRTQPL